MPDPMTPRTGRKSGGKRKAIESTGANNNLQSGNTQQLPAQPAGKRRKMSRTDPTGSQATYKKPEPKDTVTRSKAKPNIRPTKGQVIDLTGDSDFEQDVFAKSRGNEAAAKSNEEKRLKRFRNEMPQATATIMQRAVTQRMFILDRKRYINDSCPHALPDCPIEVVDLAGTTGNVYTVTIEHVPRCTCPNFAKGNPQCKHILYVLVKVLKAPGNLQYQLAFLTSELHEIFQHAGPLPTETTSAKEMDGKRKPVEGDCPICVEEADEDSEEIVWCRAGCGNNLHKSCFDQWAASKGGGEVTCPFCRTQWEVGVNQQVLKNINRGGAANHEGYVNIARQLGVSGERDYSSYHEHWVRRERAAGRI